MPTPPLTPLQFRKLRRWAVSAALKFRPGEPAAAKDLAHRALVDVFKPDGPGWTESDPKRLFKLVSSRIWSLSGRDTQRFDPLRAPVVLDDDSFKAPATNWRPGFIPNPLQLLLAKEKQLQGEARYAKLEASVKDDVIARILLDDNYEAHEAQAEALRRGHTPGQINDARRRLKRHLIDIVAEEEKTKR